MLKLIDTKREAEAQQEYADIVYRLSVGRNPSFEEVVTVLNAAGNTAVELTRDVAAKQQS